jgi:hypothetical protein
VRGTWLAILVVACTGETVQTPTTDAGGGDVGSTACSPVPDNLLKNPSFETWNDTIVGSWPVENPIPPRKKTGGAADCATWVEFEYDCYQWIRQTVTFTTPVPAGTVVEAGASLRHIAGNYGPINIEIWTDADESTGPGFEPTDDWTAFKSTRTLDKPTMSLAIKIIGDDCQKQTFGIDRAWLIIKK